MPGAVMGDCQFYLATDLNISIAATLIVVEIDILVMDISKTVYFCIYGI